MTGYYASPTRQIINSDYLYQQITNGCQQGKYILYFKGCPYIVRTKVKELREFVKGHYGQRKSCNFAEPKYELKYFNPLERRDQNEDTI